MIMEWLKIPTSTELVRVRTDEIVGVVADGNYSDMWLYDGRKHKLTFKLHFFDEAFNCLKDNPFVRIGRSLIINKQYVYIINLTDRQCIMAGQPLKGEFKFNAPRAALEALKKYLETDKNDDKPNWQTLLEEGGKDED